ncbi:MAG: DUF4974 domain-containing protein [Muribaculaceae bacterium]|nr:DUF4974 domain-containing protein [Muribaculaceae bacterium]
MTELKYKEESLKFVANHFKDGALLPREGWRRFKLTHHVSSFRRKFAAACAVAVVLAASASIYFFSSYESHYEPNEKITEVGIESKKTEGVKISKIHFNNAPLKDVVAEIERVYDVKIKNVPDEEIMVTISYEGTASDVVETINDLFNTNLTISSNLDQK